MASIKPQVESLFNWSLVEYFDNSTDYARMNSHVGKTIAMRLKALQKGQSWLAEKAGVSVNAVSKWTISGKISREKAVIVAEALGLTMDQLFGRDMVPTTETEMDTALERVNEKEAELLQLFRRCSVDGQNMILAAARVAPRQVLFPPLRIGDKP